MNATKAQLIFVALCSFLLGSLAYPGLGHPTSGNRYSIGDIAPTIQDQPTDRGSPGATRQGEQGSAPGDFGAPIDSKADVIDMRRPAALPNEMFQVRLIKNALVALNNANVTGNYAVLRDLCSPAVREQNKVSDFALAFHKSQDRNLDMSIVMGIKPFLSRSPSMSTDGRLRLVGFFPTTPQVLHFDLAFLKTARGDWWIDRIVVKVDSEKQPS